jgi:hypothetical protein
MSGRVSQAVACLLSSEAGKKEKWGEWRKKMRKLRKASVLSLFVLMALGVSFLFAELAQARLKVVTKIVYVNGRARIYRTVTMVPPDPDFKALNILPKVPKSNAFYNVQTEPGWSCNTDGQSYMNFTSNETITHFPNEGYIAYFDTSIPTSEWNTALSFQAYDSAGQLVDSGDAVFGGNVGGIGIPVDKLALLAPYLGLTSTILVAAVVTAFSVKRVERRKEKQ